MITLRSTAAIRALHRLARVLVLPFGRRDNPVAGWLFDLLGGVYRTAGMTFEVPRELTTRAFRGRFFLDRWERPETALVQRFVQPEARVLEIGGGLGVVAGHVQRRLARPEDHVVVEAHPGLIPVLRRNRERNLHRYRIEHTLVSATSDGTFHLHPLIVGGSTVRSTDRQVRVPVVSYDELQCRHGLVFDTLVLDLEGGETEFFQEIRHRLPQIRTLVVELHELILGPEAIESGRRLLSGAGLVRLAARGTVEVWGRT